MNFDSGLLIEFYKKMYLIRAFESRLLTLFSEGFINGTVHTCIGQEGCDVGTVMSLDNERDIIFSNHRAHGHFITYCDKVEELLAEIMGKASGICGGIGGSQHLHYKNLYTNGIQGGIVPGAVGAALAEKKKMSGAIVMVFLGDGTMGQGVVYEGFNLASLWNLPIIFVLEDNEIAQTTLKKEAHAGNLSDRALPFDIKTEFVDSYSVEDVYSKVQNVVNFVRSESRPYFVHVKTYRFSPHSKGDDTRSKSEIEQILSRDAINHIKEKINPTKLVEIEININQRIELAVKKAKEDSELTFEDFLNRNCLDI